MTDPLSHNIPIDDIWPERVKAIESNTCSVCGGTATQFTDLISFEEYRISGACQVCQDKIFVEEEE